jgi:hypothetical protein
MRTIVFLVLIFLLAACTIERDIRQAKKSNIIRLSSNELNFNTHLKNGNYIISLNDSIRGKLVKRFQELPDSSVFKLDTIDLQLTNPYLTKKVVARELRKSFEMNKVQIFSLTKSRYLDKIKRTVSRSQYNAIHSYYLYQDIKTGDTILESYSFDTGGPSF